MINLSDKKNNFFNYAALIFYMFGTLFLTYNLIISKLNFFSFIGIIFIIVFIYFIDLLLHIYNAELDENHLYLKGIFCSKTIELCKIKNIKQKNGLKRNYEKLIQVKQRKKTGFFDRIYIMPNDSLNYGEKHRNKNFLLLSEYIEKAKLSDKTKPST